MTDDDHDDDGRIDPIERAEMDDAFEADERQATEPVPGHNKPVTMPERAQIADRLLAALFSMRPDDGDAGSAWCMDQACNAVARAILAANGWQNSPEDLIETCVDQIREKIDATRKQFRQRALATRH